MDIDLLKIFLEVNKIWYFGWVVDNLYLILVVVSVRVC